MNKIHYIFSFFAALVLLLLTCPANHTEAEDAFEYSRLVEQGSGAEIFHPRHLLYLPAGKAVVRLCQAGGYGGRAYPVLVAISMFSGAAALVSVLGLMRLLVPSGSDGRFGAFLAMGGLLFSYGFWRYACETEIYVPGLALVLGAMLVLSKGGDSFWAGAVYVLLAAFAVLLHVVNVVPALLIAPLLAGRCGRNYKRVAMLAVLSAVLVCGTYLWVDSVWGTYMPYSDTPAERFFQRGFFLKAIIGFGQCLLSGNFLFAYPSFSTRLQDIFPYRMFAEELFMGAHISPLLRVCASVTFLFSLVLLPVSFLAAVARKFSWTVLILLVWLGGVAFPTMALEPSNPELWIFSLVPLWMLFGWFVASIEKVVRRRICVAGVLLLGLHNWAGGMAPLQSDASDYNVQKSAWIRNHAQKGDVVLTADSFVFLSYLKYWTAAEVLDMNNQSWRRGEKTYVLGDVFAPPASLAVRYPDKALRVRETADAIKNDCSMLYDDAFGGVWIME